MRQRYQQMQEEVSKLLTERSSLSQELEKVNFNFAQVVEQMQQMSPDAANSVNVVEVQNSLAHTQAHLEAKQSECDQMRQDLSQRLGDSSRFITFFKGKRERLLSDRERDKSDFICDRLS